MDLIRLLIDTIAFVLMPVALIAFVAGRLLGTRHSVGHLVLRGARSAT